MYTTGMDQKYTKMFQYYKDLDENLEALYRMPHGSNFNTINFAWKLPENETVHYYESSHAKAILTVTQQLPAFHSQQMHKDLIGKYRNATTASPSVLHFLY